ncbi:hypothetical protein [Streptomyces sp. RerS4]|uniref:hypothetical protein n=1 Tax=Streptomyces sp. RerS4 TaxID=2942449 RepID=UPI00201BEF97|nr:hypothetical protein [Streptomyces sp. RerS4]UQX03764.1 hypothetical protein M4D82_27155 [Streptomyces sp. RerS4]
MTGGDWFLLAFAGGPLVLFGVLLAVDIAGMQYDCHTCGHAKDRHHEGPCRGPAPAGPPCGCPAYAAPPREPSGPIGCGG